MTYIGGFDDWQGQTLWRSSAFTSATVPLVANQVQDLIYDRGSSFGSMLCEMSTATNGARFSVQHNRNSPDANYYQGTEWHLQPGMKILATMPVLSNWFGMRVACSSAGPCTALVRTQRLNLSTDRIHYHAPEHTLAADNVLLAAGGANFYVAPWLLPGPAHMWIQGPAAGSTIDIQLYAVDKDGFTRFRVAQWFTITGTFHQPIQLPHSYWQIRVGNGGGAAQTFSFTLTAQGSLV